MVRSVIQALKSAEKVALTGHVRPDGDAVCSVLAMAAILKTIGTEHIDVFLPDPAPEQFSFLPGFDTISSPPETSCEHDLLVALDTATYERAGIDIRGKFGRATVMCIDHHVSNERWGDINWIAPKASATCLLLYRLAFLLDVDIDADLATLLFTGLMTDTGYFRHTSTSPEAFACASDLVSRGADCDILYRRVFANKPLADIKLMGMLLAQIRTTCDDKIAWVEVPRDLKERAGTETVDIPALFSNICSIPGLDVGVCLEEQSREFTVAELRSTGRIDVGAVAEEFGGGGHLFAAGCRFRCSPDKARLRLLPALNRAVVRSTC